MDIRRSADFQLQAANPAWFHGEVEIAFSLPASAPARAGVALVRFAPGGRTAWHTHPLGQTLFITDGEGYVQRAGGPLEKVKEGDVVWFPPGEKHWHGATEISHLEHLAIHEALDGKTVDWLEHVDAVG